MYKTYTTPCTTHVVPQQFPPEKKKKNYAGSEYHSPHQFII
jgi:hypothetical protein